MEDHNGNLLFTAACALCGKCWKYGAVRDPRHSSLIGTCIYGGPYRGFVEGYRDGEVEAARTRAYGTAALA